MKVNFTCHLLDMRCLERLIYILLLTFISCEVSNSPKSITALKNFRKQVEGTVVNKPIQKINPNNNLVSFLVENVKEIFSEVKKSTINVANSSKTIVTIQPSTKEMVSQKKLYKIKSQCNMNKISEKEKRESGNQIEEHVKNNVKLRNETHLNILSTQAYPRTTAKINELKNLKKLPISRRIQSQVFDSISKMNDTDFILSKRSCILCNNVENIDCINPKNKLISSTVCEHDEDQCYSLHTPFRIVSRGCFNINHNITTYVCSCNLCNYISISEMPRIFSTRKDWIENVIELSRTKRLRKTILKDISCLRCEVNSKTAKDTLEIANCLEGNIGSLPIQECAENEICGVKAIRSEGYIWRGCLTSPLYNYWWTFCNSDLCNYDNLISIHDEFLEM